MKWLLYIAVLSCCICSCAKQQPPPIITGTWEGYYVYDFPILDTTEKVLRDSMKMVIDIRQVDDSTLTCKTITGGYVDATGKGKFNAAAENVTLVETKIESVKQDTSNIEICLSNYFLHYKKVNSEEQLTGTVTSQRSVNGVDCGGGDLHLKKVKN